MRRSIALPLLAALSAALAVPAAAGTRGACTGGSLWWAEGRLAGLGPCESPEEGFFLLACGPGGVTLDAVTDAGVAPGAPAAATLSVDGAPFALSGEGTFFPRTEVVGIGRAPVPPPALDALRRGAAARFDFPAETRDIHLSGSAAAIGAMLAACGG